jgi:hypothetical protein
MFDRLIGVATHKADNVDRLFGVATHKADNVDGNGSGHVILRYTDASEPFTRTSWRS